MEKQILKRGYVTYALTNGKGQIFGMIKDHAIGDWSYHNPPFYWSEVYCEPSYMATIIRKGMLITNATNNELNDYHEQSKINLND